MKSCVGSTWCRYGVQDSVGLAIAPREPLQGPAQPAQAQVRGLGLRARVRRGAGQGLRRHRHREGLQPLRLRQRRHEAAARAVCSRPISTRTTVDPLPRPLPDVLRAHRRPPASARRPGSTSSKAASTTCARWSSRTRWASAPSSRPTCSTSSTPTSASGRRRSTDPEKLRAVPHLRQQRRAPIPASCSCRERDQHRPATLDEKADPGPGGSDAEREPAPPGGVAAEDSGGPGSTSARSTTSSPTRGVCALLGGARSRSSASATAQRCLRPRQLRSVQQGLRARRAASSATGAACPRSPRPSTSRASICAPGSCLDDPSGPLTHLPGARARRPGRGLRSCQTAESDSRPTSRESA